MRARHFLWPLLVVLSACGGSSPDDIGGGQASVTELSFNWPFSSGANELYVFVADDTAAGDTLRSAVADAVASYDARLAVENDRCRPPFDPAALHPVRRDAWVVHPSRSGDERISGYPADPALRWRSTQRTAEDAARWESALSDSLAEPAPDGAAFRPLESLSDTAALLGQDRPAQSDAEQALLDSLDPATLGVFTLAAASEDASPNAPETYVVAANNVFIESSTVPARTPSEGLDCRNPGQASPRFQAWLDAAHITNFSPWPCENPPILAPLSDDCVWRCLESPVAVNDEGAADCIVTTRIAVDDQCPTDLGWQDPLDASGVPKPTVVHDRDGDYRICEVRQLEGAALASCRTSLDCEDCEPGFCVTEVPELVPSDRCAQGAVFPPFRFVGGAGQARNATGFVTCHAAAP